MKKILLLPVLLFLFFFSLTPYAYASNDMTYTHPNVVFSNPSGCSLNEYAVVVSTNPSWTNSDSYLQYDGPFPASAFPRSINVANLAGITSNTTYYTFVQCGQSPPTVLSSSSFVYNPTPTPTPTSVPDANKMTYTHPNVVFSNPSGCSLNEYAVVVSTNPSWTNSDSYLQYDGPFPASAFPRSINVANLAGITSNTTYYTFVQCGQFPPTVLSSSSFVYNPTSTPTLTPTPTPTPTLTPTPTPTSVPDANKMTYTHPNVVFSNPSGCSLNEYAVVVSTNPSWTNSDSYLQYDGPFPASAFPRSINVANLAGITSNTTYYTFVQCGQFPPTVLSSSSFVYNPTSTPIVNINAGGNTEGNFVADMGFSGGSQYSTNANVNMTQITNPAPEAVYQSVRYGNFSYTISNLTPNASYTAKLHFNELYWNSSGHRVFNVLANSQQVLSNYDIYAAAGGKDKAIVEQVPVTADVNGNVTLQFATVTDNAMVNGIQVYSGTLPSPSPTPTPTPASTLAVNAGGEGAGNFASDHGFSGGSTHTTSNVVDLSGVTNPAPTSVYQSVRYGNFSYTLSNLLPSTNYLVRLHFNELYWNSTNQRIFNVSINGQQVLGQYDIYAVAGGANRAVIEQFIESSDASGKITVTFSAVTDNAMVNAIEVENASNVATYTLTGTVFNDIDNNGFQDNGESGMNGITVALNNGVTTTSDNNGNYSFNNLLTNSYRVHTVLPSGYTSTTQNPAILPITSNTTLNFGLTQQSYAINAGGSSSGIFLTDQNYTGGSVYTTTTSVDTTGVTNPAPEVVYQTVRYGNFSYTIPNLTPNSTHTIRLHFNELYWQTEGSRVFTISVNGTQVIENYDIYQAAGGANKAVVEDVQGTTDANGNFTIQFNSVTDNAMVNGIELLN